jgi:hypothetical protein
MSDLEEQMIDIYIVLVTQSTLMQTRFRSFVKASWIENSMFKTKPDVTNLAYVKKKIKRSCKSNNSL